MKVHHRKQENDTSLNTGFSYIALRYITDVKWGVHGPCLVALKPGISHPHSMNLTSRPLSQLAYSANDVVSIKILPKTDSSVSTDNQRPNFK